MKQNLTMSGPDDIGKLVAPHGAQVVLAAAGPWTSPSRRNLQGTEHRWAVVAPGGGLPWLRQRCRQYQVVVFGDVPAAGGPEAAAQVRRTLAPLTEDAKAWTDACDAVAGIAVEQEDPRLLVLGWLEV